MPRSQPGLHSNSGGRSPFVLVAARTARFRAAFLNKLACHEPKLFHLAGPWIGVLIRFFVGFWRPCWIYWKFHPLKHELSRHVGLKIHAQFFDSPLSTALESSWYGTTKEPSMASASFGTKELCGSVHMPHRFHENMLCPPSLSLRAFPSNEWSSGESHYGKLIAAARLTTVFKFRSQKNGSKRERPQLGVK